MSLRASRIAFTPSLLTTLLSLGALAFAGCGGGSKDDSPAPGPSAGVPVISSIAPAAVPAGSSGFTLTVNGSGFNTTSVVELRGTAEATTYVSTTQLQAAIPGAQVVSGASLQVSVANGQTSSDSSQAPALQVNNPVPAITSISPPNVPAGSAAFSLDVLGNGFVPNSTVSIAGAPVGTSFVSADELRASVPASTVAAGASLQASVSNPGPGGGQSPGTALTVRAPQPSIATLSPATVPTGAAAVILLAGVGFEANSVVLWNDVPRPTTFLSASKLSVALSADDLVLAGSGRLAVSNPGPDASVSQVLTLTITQTAPVIQSVTLGTLQQPGGCDQIQATITGSNFAFQGGVQVNGVSLTAYQVFSFSPNRIVATLPTLSGPGLSFVVTSGSFPPLASAPFQYPASAPPFFSVCGSPNPATVYAGTSFAVTLQASLVNTGATPTVSLGSLPAGVTLKTALPLALPPAGALVQLKADSTVKPGTYSIPVTGQVGSLSNTGQLTLNVQQGAPPAFFWLGPEFNEAAVTIGAAAQRQFVLQAYPPVDYSVTPTVGGLPPGITATFSPAVLVPGQTTTLTIQAAANAPVTMNTTVTVTGTADAPVAPATTSFLVDVTQAPGSRPNNGTDFISTGGTPVGAVYDPVHHLVFSSNPVWDRVDVIDALTHKIVRQLDIRDPRGLDLTPDGSRLWVATGSRQMFAVDPSSFAMTSVQLPLYQNAGWEGSSVFALANGTLLLGFSEQPNTGINYAAIWNPANNTFSPLAASFPVARSGDGTRVYFETSDSVSCNLQMYSTASLSLTNGPQLSERCGFGAVNRDGSRLVLSTSGSFSLYDGSFTLLGALPTDVPNGTISGSDFLFSPDSSTLYQITSTNAGAVIDSIDVASLSLNGTAPAMATLPISVSEVPIVSALFGVDSNGLLLGIQDFGISFEDPTFFQNYAASQPGVGFPVSITPQSGPLAGGTVSNVYGGYALTPDIWYGSTHGTASLGSANSLNITSPQSSAGGPVNLKFLYPDGEEVFAPQSFSYGPFPQYSILSGAAPEGGVPGQLSGYGMPVDASGGTVTIGGNTAAITTQATQYPPYAGEPFPSTFLEYTIPAGAPGWADLQVQTPDGTGTLPKAVFYASSVTDYASRDSFTAALYDNQRQQVYLSAGDHIDIFSMRSRQFLAPLLPASQGTAKQFTGLTLTPDGTSLLAADLLDGSLAVINPDSPSTTYSIPIAAAQVGNPGCTNGPMYVAATSSNLAFVTTGDLPGTGCPPDGAAYLASLQSRSVINPPTPVCGGGLASSPFTFGISVDASADGSLVVTGSGSTNPSCIYSTNQNTYSTAPGRLLYGLGIAVSGDGNVLGSAASLADPLGNLVGRLAHPAVEFGAALGLYNESSYPASALMRPRLNASGSLYYWAYPHYFDILDVAHGTVHIRFSLNETVTNTAAPIAVDAGGRQVFLLTDKGLTVVDLGAAPLSIGHLGQASAAAGAQVLVRGSGFTAGTSATVGGQPTAVNFTDDSTLTLTMPALASGPQDIVLSNPDGTIYTLQSAIAVP